MRKDVFESLLAYQNSVEENRLSLDSEIRRLLDQYLHGFRRNGLELGEATRQKKILISPCRISWFKSFQLGLKKFKNKLTNSRINSLVTLLKNMTLVGIFLNLDSTQYEWFFFI